MQRENIKAAKCFAGYLFTVLILSLLMVTFVMQKTVVVGDSMSPTLLDGDSVFVSKLQYLATGPKRFDIIVFKYLHQENQYYIKRIVGLPGETVQIDKGKIYIDGEALAEDYGNEPINDAKRADEPIVLGEDEYFVLGDNRNHSFDSREKDVGNVKEPQILGKAFLVVWPMSRAGILKHQ